MKIAKKNVQSVDVLSSGSSGQITAENYSQRAVAFMRGCGGNGFVIRSIEGAKGSLATGEKPTDAQWLAWMDYYRMKGIPYRFAQSHGLVTVPCEWPELFDYDAPVSEKTARLQLPPAPISGQKRAEVQQKITALSRRLAAKAPAKSKTFNVADMSPAMAAEHLDKLREKASESISPLSPAALRSIAPELVGKSEAAS